jgi:diacylglycerol kinase (ATP)
MGRAAIIYNPISGSGGGEAASIASEKKLLQEGWCVERIATRDHSGATPIARKLADKVDLLVVAGGDGSIRETISGLEDAASYVKLGLIPLGNANVTCRELGIPLDRDAAVDVLVSGSPVPVDLGFVNGELFLAMVGVGWDALTVQYVDRLRHSKLGRIWYRTWAASAYALSGLVAAFQFRPPQFTLISDGRTRAQSYRAAVLCSFGTYAKGWSMAPEAHFQSGRLHFQARKRSSIPFLAWHLAAAALGRKTPRLISDYGSAQHLVVECQQPLPVQVDGDFKGYFKKLELSVEAAAVQILAPQVRRAALETARMPRAGELHAPVATG